MKKLLLTAALVIALAAGAYAQCPHTVGIFTSTGGGPVLNGRVSEAWCNGNPGQPGNTEDAYSWDGATLGTQWHVWGMAMDAAGAVLIADTVNQWGYGTRTYQTFYDGGQFLLDAAGPWGDGWNDVTGSITSYLVVTTMTFVGGQVVGATSNVSFTGYFSECPQANGCAIEFGIANATRVWMSGQGTMPAGYPAFLCNATLGELFDACCVTISIQCTVGAEEATWGSLKGLFR